MKKKFLLLICTIIIVIGCAIFLWLHKNNNDDNKNLTSVKVAEVAHSVFYAPQYLADSLGYFEDEGLDVEINLTAGADNVMSAVLAKDADIGFCGTEATIYVVD